MLRDYVSRLEAAGFTVKVFTPLQLTPFDTYAVQENEPVVLGYK